MANSPIISSAYLQATSELKGNKAQLAAYNSQGNCVVLAGPGSGKTKILVLKLAKILAEEVRPPRGVACITYSHECARELLRRLGELGLTETSRLFVGTVHGFCFRHILMPYAHLTDLNLPYPLKIAPVSHTRWIYQTVSENLYGVKHPYKQMDVDRHRRTCLDRQSRAWRQEEEYAILADAYEKKLHQDNYIDFDDMIIYAWRLITEYDWVLPMLKARFPALAVDEYQDLGIGLHEIVKRLTFDGDVRLFAVGDADQSVYGFTGADSTLLNELATQEKIECIRLTTNYRCAQNLVTVSEQILGEHRGYKAYDDQRQAHIVMHECKDGLEEQAEYAINTIIPAILEQESGYQLGDIAILYRNANIGDYAAQAATDSGIDYIRIDNQAPYRKCNLTSWIEDCAAWCSGGWKNSQPLLHNLLTRWYSFRSYPLNNIDRQKERTKLVGFLWKSRGNQQANDFVDDLCSSLLDDLIESEPSLFDQAQEVELMKASLQKGGVLHELDMSRLGGRDGSSNQLNLLTLHSAKGCEYKVVIMIGLDEGTFHWTTVHGEELQESRRLFYVGLTRAKNQIYMLYSGWNESRHGNRFYSGRLRFLDEIEIT